jgi:hypothetical protein
MVKDKYGNYLAISGNGLLGSGDIRNPQGAGYGTYWEQDLEKGFSLFTPKTEGWDKSRFVDPNMGKTGGVAIDGYVNTPGFSGKLSG